jgi:hypothetical protein
MLSPLQIRMDLKHLKTKRQKAQQKHKNESEQLAVSHVSTALCYEFVSSVTNILVS